MEKKTINTIVVVGIIIIFILVLSIKFYNEDSGELNDYEEIKIIKPRINESLDNSTLENISFSENMSGLISIGIILIVSVAIISGVLNSFRFRSGL